MKPEVLILRRLLKELQGAGQVALGPGIPTLIRPYVREDVQVVLLRQNGLSHRPVDLVVLDAAEISDEGDLSLTEPIQTQGLKAQRWIVATRHTRDDGEPKIVRDCRLPVSCPRCVRLIITELGVIEVTDQGLVLSEVAPGVATDDVKKKTAASLHVADDIKVMEL